MRSLFALCLSLLLFTLLRAASLPGTVTGVTDGDTIRLLQDGRDIKIRLHGIDAPEAGQPYGARAKQFASALVFGKPVRADILETDRYGRSVALVFLEDGRCLNHELVRHGFAWWYAQYAPGDSTLETLQRQAQEAGVGLWADAHPVAPWAWRRGERGPGVDPSAAPRAPPGTPQAVESPAAPPHVESREPSSTAQEIVYRTRTGAKYHRGGCRYLKSVIPTTVGEAVAMGLGACSVCGPPGLGESAVLGAGVEQRIGPQGDGAMYGGRCQAITRKGTQCKRSAEGGGFCWQHGK